METLDTTGFLLTEVAGEWAVLTADFGDGYQADAVVGHPAGTRTWTIKIDVLPDTADAPGILDTLDADPVLLEDGGVLLLESGEALLLEGGSGNPFPQSTRASYLWRFFRISKAGNDAPFWFECDDPDDGERKRFLASFTDNTLTYTILCAKLYSSGLQLRERRVGDVVSPVLVT